MFSSKGFPQFPMCLLTKIQSMSPPGVGPSPSLGTAVAVLSPNTDVDTFKCLHHPPVSYQTLATGPINTIGRNLATCAI